MLSYFTYFSTGVINNLHVVLIMDCTNTNFSINCESNPAFFKQCSVQWLDGWSRESMVDVPRLLLTRPSKEAGATLGRQARKRQLSGGDELLKGFLNIHESCQQFGSIATPRRYMSFVHTYNDVYTKKKDKIEERQRHLKVSERV